MKTAPLFDQKHAAIIIRDSLMKKLHDLQIRILLAERFKENVVVFPTIQSRPGLLTTSLGDMLSEQDDLVHKIETINNALDRADDLEMKLFAQEAKRRHK